MNILELAKKAGEVLGLKPDQEEYLVSVLDRAGTAGKPVRSFLVVRDGSTRVWSQTTAPPRSNVIQASSVEYINVRRTFKNWWSTKPTLAYVGDERVLVLESYQFTPEQSLEHKRNMLTLMSEGKIPSNEEDRKKLMDEINPPPPPKLKRVTLTVEVVAEVFESADPNDITFKGIEKAIPQAQGVDVGTVIGYTTQEYFTDPRSKISGPVRPDSAAA